MQPPVFRSPRHLIIDPVWHHFLFNIFERNLVVCSLLFRHIDAEIYDPYVATTLCNIDSINPTPDYVGVGLPMWVGFSQHFIGNTFRDVKRPNLANALKCQIFVLGQLSGAGQV